MMTLDPHTCDHDNGDSTFFSADKLQACVSCGSFYLNEFLPELNVSVSGNPAPPVIHDLVEPPQFVEKPKRSAADVIADLFRPFPHGNETGL